MLILENFLKCLQQYFIQKSEPLTELIKINSRLLEHNGEIRVPLNISNWQKYVSSTKHSQRLSTKERQPITIFDISLPDQLLDRQIEHLIYSSQQWPIRIIKCEVSGDKLHLFLDRCVILHTYPAYVLKLGSRFGVMTYNSSCMSVELDNTFVQNVGENSLRALRATVYSQVLKHFVDNMKWDGGAPKKCFIGSNTKSNSIPCGEVYCSSSDSIVSMTARQVLDRRKNELQLIAQHKYGFRMSDAGDRQTYFENISRASLIFDFLEVKPQRTIKIGLQDNDLVRKKSTFVFYNCARISVLLKKFQCRIERNEYPAPPLDNDILWHLLSESEEWELVFIFIAQFPSVLQKCIRDIDKCVVNFQYIIFFLFDLSSLFSQYYRRVKILTEPRKRNLQQLYARIGLVRCIQQIFHTSFRLFGIDPIDQM